MAHELTPEEYKRAVRFGYIREVSDNQFIWLYSDWSSPLLKDAEKASFEAAGKCIRCQTAAAVNYKNPFCEPCKAVTVLEDKKRMKQEKEEFERAENDRRAAKLAEEKKLREEALPKSWTDAMAQQREEKKAEEKRRDRLSKKRKEDNEKKELIRVQLMKNKKKGATIEAMLMKKQEMQKEALN